jgi:hypothetical protein
MVDDSLSTNTSSPPPDLSLSVVDDNVSTVSDSNNTAFDVTRADPPNTTAFMNRYVMIFILNHLTMIYILLIIDKSAGICDDDDDKND